MLDRLLKLLHPVMPFVTEELWTALTGGDSIMIAPWPGLRPAGGAGDAAEPAAFRDPAAEAEIGSLMRLVTEVRRFRSDQGLRPGQQVPAVLAGIEGTRLAPHETSIRSLLRLTAPGDSFAATASVLAEGITVELDTAAGIDVAAERRRLDKDLAAARKEADQAGRKLANESFLAKAPADVVAKTRARLEAARADIERITGRLAALPGRGTRTGGAAGRTLEHRRASCARRRARSSRGALSTPSSRPWTGWPRSSRSSATRSGPIRSSTSPARTARPRPPG